MNTPGTQTFKQFARTLGVQPSYITELKGAGRLLLSDDGRRVRVAETLALLRDTRDPARAGVAARHAAGREQGGAVAPSAAQAGESAAEGADEALPSTFADPVSDGHARRRAKALADKAETDAKAAERDYRLSLGELLEASQVEHAVRDAVATFRTSLENLPNTLAPELAAVSDEGRIRVVLGEALEHALEELARKFASIGRAE